ncbi:cupin domain-containing protein [Pseudomonas sp. NPDC007930]|uniref:cupin domain-containing protein n=1 Tax=Pseudomonas sp. NPDC007930 TaxID=3364417 RepID=UPI0036EEDD10
MIVIHGNAEGSTSEKRTSTFTGDVWADPILPATDAGGVSVTLNHVHFLPGGRTHWHTHEHGQVLQVTAGRGWVCLEGQRPQAIGPGDTVFIAAGERHWHGASVDGLMSHIATSIGQTRWEEPVADSDYP